ncbi:MAG: flagellar basal-body rod protein FlgG [Candidatus Margulisbacteria bacterium GWF2_35_9]|nr:MAG: flagellar basal-body rod protein FlgG [Candidatus Margulisbacteria bacterium GWF2_35_9]
MLRQFYVGATGMAAFEKAMINITNNVSNSKTVGYKSTRTEMENIFPQVLDRAIVRREENSNEPAGIELGSGVRIVSTPKDFRQGAIAVTNNEFDVAINGEGFLVFQTPNEELAYSRAGNLNRDSEGNLVDPNGNMLQPQIIIPDNTDTVRISSDGTVFVTLNQETIEREVGQIRLAKFVNPSGLESIGGNLFKETVASGEAALGIAGEENFGSISQYAIESSNVDIIGEMMEMVITQRAFDIITKAIQSGETMLKSATEIARS